MTLPEKYFSGGANLTNPEGLQTLLDGRATATTEELHLYADGDSGDDTLNDGLSASTPKATLQAVFDLVPDIVKHNIAVHLSGTFSEFGDVYLERAVTNGAVLLIDGGADDVTTVADNSGDPWEADIVSTGSIGLTTAGWTPDDYVGYLVVVLSGPATGQTRLIQGHDATTITPVRNFSESPGAGAQFRIVKPATTLSASSTYSRLNIGRWGNIRSWMFVQNLYMEGSTVSINPGYNLAGQAPWLTHIVCDATTTAPIYWHTSQPLTTGWKYDPVTFTQDYNVTDSCAGISIRNASKDLLISNFNNGTFSASYITSLDLQRGFMANLNFGTRIEKLRLVDVSSRRLSAPGIQNSSGYAPTRLGGSTIGIEMLSSRMAIGGGVDISGCSSHAIVCENSWLHLDGVVTGSSNTGAGVYTHSGSTVHINNGETPTLTGTVGDLSFDGSSQASTWAAIDAGTPATSTAEMSMAKEV